MSRRGKKTEKEDEMLEIINALDASLVNSEEVDEDELFPTFISGFEIDSELMEQLAADSVSLEWLEENAPWLQCENESDFQYLAFKHFCLLPISEWEGRDALHLFSQKTGRKVNKNEAPMWDAWREEFDWIPRRLAFSAYYDWLSRKSDEMQQLSQIGKFRNNQATLLAEVSSATIGLVKKLGSKIDKIRPEEIQTKDVPSFISALVSFLNLAADAEARVLSVSQLLDFFEEQMDTQLLKEHIFYVGPKMKEEMKDGTET